MMLLVYFAFKPKYSALMAMTMLACTFNMGGILPVAVGLLCSPLALIPMALGVVSCNMITTARDNFSILSSQSERLTEIEKVIYYIDCLFQNEKMLLLIIAFSLTVMIVYWIRRRPHSYAWSVAIAVGVLVLVLILLIGNVVFDIAIVAPALIISCILGVLAACVAMLFGFVVDGTRTEYLEYEDDEYYYFVKAIPKITVTVSQKRVTSITGKTEQENAREKRRAKRETPETIMLPKEEMPSWGDEQKEIPGKKE